MRLRGLRTRGAAREVATPVHLLHGASALCGVVSSTRWTSSPEEMTCPACLAVFAEGRADAVDEDVAAR